MNWRVFGAGVAGAHHAERDLGCDDAYGWSIGAGLTVLVIADGAGSQSGTSAIGAHVAVTGVIALTSDPSFRLAHAEDPAPAIIAVVRQVIDTLMVEAGMLGVPYGALATTLCLAVLTEHMTSVAQIGDGVAVVERASGAIQTVAVAERFEYANETVFLTAPDALEHLKIFTADEDLVRSVAMSTDGLRYKVLDDLRMSEPFEQFFRESWAWARDGSASSPAIADFLREVDDQTGDDKTLVLAVRDFIGEPGDAIYVSDRPPGSPEHVAPSDPGATPGTGRATKGRSQ